MNEAGEYPGAVMLMWAFGGMPPSRAMPSGPVVIDWTNACAGTPGADVATAYLIMVTSEVDDLKPAIKAAAKLLRGTLVRQFRSAAGVDLGPHLAPAARARMQDRNVRPAEAQQLRRIAEQAERS